MRINYPAGNLGHLGNKIVQVSEIAVLQDVVFVVPRIGVRFPMADLRFPTKKQAGQGICLFVLLCSVYGVYPSLKKLPASNWIQLITGLSSSAAALVVAGVGYKNYQELQRKNARDAETAEQNYQALVDKNTADRFSKAIEQLGNENSIHVRLGGIFALEQIANTEDKYYWQIMEILTAYVRTRSPSSSGSHKISDDIQAVMTVLSRRKRSYKNGEAHRIDLTNTNLNKLQLSTEAKFQGVDLSNANLDGVRLPQIHLEQAILSNANLENAFLPGANLDNSDLTFANLTDAELLRASLISTDLWCAELVRTNFQDADLRKARLYAYLEGARFDDANLEEADFRGYGSDFEDIAPTQSQLDSAKSYTGAKLTTITHS
jgi:uncharacterized protein YjbI with pentapeptide repeats